MHGKHNVKFNFEIPSAGFKASASNRKPLLPFRHTYKAGDGWSGKEQCRYVYHRKKEAEL
jgi:hypothetical protein